MSNFEEPAAVVPHGGICEGADKIWTRFQRWIAQRYEIKTNQSWMQIIWFFSRDEFDALDNFFKLLDEFKQQVSSG